MKKICFVCAALMAVVLILASCAETSSPGNDTEGTAITEYAHYFENNVVFNCTDISEEDMLHPFSDKFEEAIKRVTDDGKARKIENVTYNGLSIYAVLGKNANGTPTVTAISVSVGGNKFTLSTPFVYDSDKGDRFGAFKANSKSFGTVIVFWLRRANSPFGDTYIFSASGEPIGEYRSYDEKTSETAFLLYPSGNDVLGYTLSYIAAPAKYFAEAVNGKCEPGLFEYCADLTEPFCESGVIRELDGSLEPFALEREFIISSIVSSETLWYYPYEKASELCRKFGADSVIDFVSSNRSKYGLWKGADPSYTSVGSESFGIGSGIYDGHETIDCGTVPEISSPGDYFMRVIATLDIISEYRDDFDAVKQIHYSGVTFGVKYDEEQKRFGVTSVTVSDETKQLENAVFDSAAIYNLFDAAIQAK